MILGADERNDGFAVGERENGRLFAFEEFFDNDAVSGFPESSGEAFADAFESFIDEARGSFISLADMAADGKKAWEWYGQFTDSLRIAPIGEGMVTDGGQPLNVLWINTTKRGVNYHFIPSATASNLKYAEQPLTTALCMALHEN